MNEDYVITGIAGLRALPLETPGRWCVTFASPHQGYCHQLYANGRLAAWTREPSQREFILDAGGAPQELAVVACRASLAAKDAAELLGLAQQGQAWRWKVTVLPSADVARQDRVQVVDGSETILAEFGLWSAHAPLWSFGHDVWGLGGFGFDGRLAPGFGMGSFAAGPLGLDTHVLRAEVPLHNERVYHLALRTVRDGFVSPLSPPITVVARGPGARVAAARQRRIPAVPGACSRCGRLC